MQFAAPDSQDGQAIAAVFRERTQSEWKEFNDEHDAMIEPILDLDDALESELVRERGMLVEVDQPELGPVRLLGLPVRFSRTPGDATRPAPALGEHTERVLAEAGFSTEEVTSLVGSGAAAGPNARAEPQRFLA